MTEEAPRGGAAGDEAPPGGAASDEAARDGAAGDEVVVVTPPDEPPSWWDAALFLAGPTPRTPDVASWRPEAVDLLRRRWTGGRLVVFSPEPATGVVPDYDGQIGWEEAGLHHADRIVFWVPREPVTMPAFTTNVEWGTWHRSGKAVFGAPPAAPKNRYLAAGARAEHVPAAEDLAATLGLALDGLSPGARRTGGEREVPLLVWRTRSFQQWYRTQTAAGHELLRARVEWVYRRGPARREVVYWALRTDIRVAGEDRVKTGQIVLARPDLSSVVLHHRGATPGETLVVLVREFRSTATTPDGFIHELPGGAGPENLSAREQAAAEVHEETGLPLPASRLRSHGVRQVAGTLSAHRAHLFSAELTAEEVAGLRAAAGTPFGEAGSTERTWVELHTWSGIRAGNLVDWPTLGMLAQVLG
ncbi:nucleoside 2-deoxyribosyltransferase domain-containing protein [Dactylosporangium sp. NPDC049140]|uniref:nucleoside 2-deoxyribosyltransferase domain-containing protein n=1 Tax=Dactylosporangium sp. NPDC049140 TaxID=3155647 RepID=UPI0033EE1EA4